HTVSVGSLTGPAAAARARVGRLLCVLARRVRRFLLFFTRQPSLRRIDRLHLVLPIHFPGARAARAPPPSSLPPPPQPPAPGPASPRPSDPLPGSGGAPPAAHRSFPR